MKLIEGGWKKAWRLWSVRFAALGSAAAAYILADPGVVFTVMNALPHAVRAFFPPFFGLGLFGVITLIRLLRQGDDSNE
tara:strand:- start:212 stop:448 length:237 start_codon:yes stop_codon:yes gene_type:complete